MLMPKQDFSASAILPNPAEFSVESLSVLFTVNVFCFEAKAIIVIE